MPMMTAEPDSPEALFAAVLAERPAQPLLTWYDRATGDRVELSAKSMANWVAKTHFLLSDELALGVGDAAFVELPAHWISVPVLLGCWTAGLEIVTTPERAAVAFVSPETAGSAEQIGDVYAIAPDSAAVGFRGSPPPDVQDYVRAVRPQPDAWSAVQPPATASDPALDGRSRAEIAAAARGRAAELGMPESARVLSTRQWTSAQGWVDALLAPLAVRGSVVMVRNPEPGTIESLITQERITTQV
jgi:uncharacterized protein (TIGR03089 family)